LAVNLTDQKDDEDEYYFDENQIRRTAAQQGFRLMHRRNGHYWLMFAEPLGFPEIDHFLCTGFVVMNGEPGHLVFDSVPDNEWRRANGWGQPGSKPLR
jgi:hypothetical protein